MTHDIALEEALLEVTRRAGVDAGFRQLALTNPTAAIAEVNPTVATHGTEIVFVDNSGNKKVIPLPDLASDITEELSDLELENVAGGDMSVGTGWSKKGKSPAPTSPASTS